MYFEGRCKSGSKTRKGSQEDTQELASIIPRLISEELHHVYIYLLVSCQIVKKKVSSEDQGPDPVWVFEKLPSVCLEVSRTKYTRI